MSAGSEQMTWYDKRYGTSLCREKWMNPLGLSLSTRLRPPGTIALDQTSSFRPRELSGSTPIAISITLCLAQTMVYRGKAGGAIDPREQ